MKKCWVCDGKGYLIKSFVGSEIAWQGRTDCRECNGTGYLSEPWDYFHPGFPNPYPLDKSNSGVKK